MKSYNFINNNDFLRKIFVYLKNPFNFYLKKIYKNLILKKGLA